MGSNPITRFRTGLAQVVEQQANIVIDSLARPILLPPFWFPKPPLRGQDLIEVGDHHRAARISLADLRGRSMSAVPENQLAVVFEHERKALAGMFHIILDSIWINLVLDADQIPVWDRFLTGILFGEADGLHFGLYSAVVLSGQ